MIISFHDPLELTTIEFRELTKYWFNNLMYHRRKFLSILMHASSNNFRRASTVDYLSFFSVWISWCSWEWVSSIIRNILVYVSSRTLSYEWFFYLLLDNELILEPSYFVFNLFRYRFWWFFSNYIILKRTLLFFLFQFNS